MAISHIGAALINLIFGAFSWITSRYLILVAANYYMTEFPEFAGIPHINFFLSIAHWGLWIFILIPTSLYLWTNTQRPEA
jgi:hypothetical protein